MRPTKYNPEICETVLGLMREGASIEEVCYELGIAKQTFYNWLELYPELMDAKKRGLDFAQGWWMKQGRKNLENKDFSATLFYMNMKNRFGWKDKSEVDNTSSDGSMTPKSTKIVFTNGLKDKS